MDQQLSLIGSNQDLQSAFQSIFSGVMPLAKGNLTVLGPKLFEIAKANFSPNLGNTIQTFLSTLFTTISVRYQREISAVGSDVGNFIESNLSPNFGNTTLNLLSSLGSTIAKQFPNMTEINNLDRNLGSYTEKFLSNMIMEIINNGATTDVQNINSWLLKAFALGVTNSVHTSVEFFSFPAMNDVYVMKPLVIKPSTVCPNGYVQAVNLISVSPSTQLPSNTTSTSALLFQVYTYVTNVNDNSRKPLTTGGYTPSMTSNFTSTKLLGPASNMTIEVTCLNFITDCILNYKVSFTCVPVGVWQRKTEYSACTVPCGNGTQYQDYLCSNSKTTTVI